MRSLDRCRDRRSLRRTRHRKIKGISVLASIHYENGLLASKETLTETTADSLIFTNEDNTFIVRLNNYPGTMPDNVDITINNQDYLELSHPRLMLEKTNSSPYVYTNEPLDEGSDLPPNNPLDDGQGVFRVRVKGPLDPYVAYEVADTLPITLTTDVESKVITLTRQPDGSYITDRIVLLPQDATTVYDGIICLRSTSGEGKLEAKLNEDIKQNLDVSKAAFVGSAIFELFFLSLESDVSTRGVAKILERELGYSTTYDGRLTKRDIQRALPNHSVWYSFSHGGDPEHEEWDPQFSFKSITVKRTPGEKEGEENIYPKDISGAIQGNSYKFVFLNACYSADERPTSNAYAMKEAFNAEDYIGWKVKVHPTTAMKYASEFFRMCDGKGEDNKPISAYSVWRELNDIFSFYRDKVKIIGPSNTRLDLTF